MRKFTNILHENNKNIIMKEYFEKAKDEIKKESELALEVAINKNQIFYNIKHMQWFLFAVMDALLEKDGFILA